MMNPANKLRNRILVRLFIRGFLFGLGYLLFLSGLFVLIFRLTTGSELPFIPVSLIMVCSSLLLVGSVLLAVLGTPSLDKLRAVIDHSTQSGGLVMIRNLPEEWRGRIAEIKLPQVSWNSGKAILLVTCGALFLTGSFYLPVSHAKDKKKGLRVEGIMEKISDDVELLLSSELIDPEKASQITEEISHIIDMAEKGNPGEIFEAIDQMERILKNSAAEKIMESVSELQELQKISDILESLDIDPMQSQGIKESELQELNKLLSELAVKDPELIKKLSEIAKKGKNLNEMTPDELRELIQNLRMNKDRIKEMLEKMQECQSCDMGSIIPIPVSELLEGNEAGMEQMAEACPPDG